MDRILNPSKAATEESVATDSDDVNEIQSNSSYASAKSSRFVLVDTVCFALIFAWGRRLRDLASGREYEESFDKIILATGAAPFRPSMPGIDLPGVFTLRNLQDTDHIKERVNRGVKQVVLLGGGFISLELAENFVRLGSRALAVASGSTNSELDQPATFVRLRVDLSRDPGTQDLVLFFQKLNILRQLAIRSGRDQCQLWVENLGHRGVLGICDKQRCFTFVEPRLWARKTRPFATFF